MKFWILNCFVFRPNGHPLYAVFVGLTILFYRVDILSNNFELSDEIMTLYLPNAVPGGFSLSVDPGVFHPVTFINFMTRCVYQYSNTRNLH
jgi:hypothetical protein